MSLSCPFMCRWSDSGPSCTAERADLAQYPSIQTLKLVPDSGCFGSRRPITRPVLRLGRWAPCSSVLLNLVL